MKFCRLFFQIQNAKHDDCPTITITVKEGCYPRASKRESIGLTTIISLACQYALGLACVTHECRSADPHDLRGDSLLRNGTA